MTDKEMDIDRAIKIGRYILSNTYGDEECEALELLLYYTRLYKEYLMDASND